MGCCSSGQSMMGHVIFQPLTIKIENCGVNDLDKIFSKMKKCLEKTEATRQKLAEKFKTMIIETGVCVLKRPELERCITAFLVNILIEIVKTSGEKSDEITKFDFHSLIKFDKTSPFVSFDNKKLEEIKKMFNLDLDNHKTISKMKNSIYEFLFAANEIKEFFTEIEDTVIVLFQSGKKFYDILKQKYYRDEKDKFTFGQIRDCLRIAENNFSNLTEVTQFISIMAKLLVEISTTIYTTARNLINPLEVSKWKKVAVDAVAKKIFEPKEIVFVYSKEKKCERIEDWEKNICYKPDDEAEQISF
jgi:hypothetical protein